MITIKKEDRPRRLIGITMGDPCGIGPEIIVKSLNSPAIRGLANYVILGNKKVLEHTARTLDIPINYHEISHTQEIDSGKRSISLLSSGEFPIKLIKKKGPVAEAGELSVQWILKGINLAMTGHLDALVTAPICKEAIFLGGSGYPGHTEMLQIFSGVKQVVMFMVGGKLRVAFATTHIALKYVPQSITTESLLRTISISNNSLKQYFGIKKPRIAICGLNPHASEEGRFGDEESKHIIPAIEKAKKKGIVCDGPVSADTIFYKALKGTYDLVVALYHDQGAIPLKLHAFETGVNITMGIPFVRTSPDHGTAYDIAGKGIANPRSMKEAIKMAVKMTEMSCSS
ncbi:MAG: 4-hydroxythreonine-4-phosphate dehydrogenase PdxA [Candidatus Brocadiaceae bacterium]|nr:4-hydroxythreonine-4-phosphate dehydrogenase PdxA [Candidatus Brocadiaceae bacterium]